MSDTAAIGLAVVLLAINAFFVGAEFALISARRSSLEPKAANSWAARVTIRAMENVSVMMACAQLGITVCSLGLGAIGEPAVAHLLEPVFASLGVPTALQYPISFTIALLIVVFLHVTVGEMVPKNIALALPDRTALILAPPLMAVATVLRPVLWVLNGAANLILRAMRVEPKDEMASAFSRDEVAGLVEQSHAHGLLDRDEAELVEGALSFTESTVDAVAVADPVTVSPGATVGEVEAAAHTSGFSRLPVRDDDGWHGYVHLKDVVALPDDQRDRPVPTRVVRRLETVEAGTPLTEALAGMRRSGAHLALVVGGEGTRARIVSLDDVLAELVGDIRHAATT